MSFNLNRKPEDQSYHDKILWIVANDLQRKDYRVKADHIRWLNGAPSEIMGHIPDIVATSPTNNFIFEVEDCTTFYGEKTRNQLATFSSIPNFICYVIIPAVCLKSNNQINPKTDMETCLRNWGLAGMVKIGICNPDTAQVTY